MKNRIMVTALEVRANLGELLDRVEDEGCSLVIAKRGSPRAVLLSFKNYLRLTLPEPEVLRVLEPYSEFLFSTTPEYPP